MSLATQLGKMDYYRPKLSRKPFLKESLPSYKESESGIFSKDDLKQKVKLNYTRKVSKGIDLSNVMNSSYLPEKDCSKINNSVIEQAERNGVYLSPRRSDKLTMRNINVSNSNNFLKSYDGSLSNFLKQKEDKNENKADLSKRVTGSYDFTGESSPSNFKNYQESSWLDGHSRRKQIGPYKNTNSSAFTLGLQMTPSLSRNLLYQRNSISNIRQAAQDELREPGSDRYLDRMEQNKNMVLAAAQKVVEEQKSKIKQENQDKTSKILKGNKAARTKLKKLKKNKAKRLGKKLNTKR